MVSTHLKNISQNGFIFPKFRGETKTIFETTTQFIFVLHQPLFWEGMPPLAGSSQSVSKGHDWPFGSGTTLRKKDPPGSHRIWIPFGPAFWPQKKNTKKSAGKSFGLVGYTPNIPPIYSPCRMHGKSWEWYVFLFRDLPSNSSIHVGKYTIHGLYGWVGYNRLVLTIDSNFQADIRLQKYSPNRSKRWFSIMAMNPMVELNNHQLPGTCDCPLFWWLNPPKQGLFQSKHGSLGFQVNKEKSLIPLFPFGTCKTTGDLEPLRIIFSIPRFCWFQTLSNSYTSEN